MQNYLEFEKPLAEIEGKAEELRAMARANEEMDVEKEADEGLYSFLFVVFAYSNITKLKRYLHVKDVFL